MSEVISRPTEEAIGLAVWKLKHGGYIVRTTPMDDFRFQEMLYATSTLDDALRWMGRAMDHSR